MEAKRRIHNFNFDRPADDTFTPHVALVSKGANNLEALTLKSADEVQITMSMRKFLMKFFSLWSDEADILAGIMGYEMSEDIPAEDMPSSYNEYIMGKVDSVQLLKGKEIPESAPQVVVEKIAALQADYEEAILEKGVDTNTQESPEGDSSTITDGEIPMEELETLKAEKAAQDEELKTLKSQLADLQTEKAAKAKIEMATLVKGYSFVTEEDQEALVDSLLAIDGDALEAVTKALESARDAVEASAMVEEGTPALDDSAPEGATGESLVEKAASIVSQRIAERNS